MLRSFEQQHHERNHHDPAADPEQCGEQADGYPEQGCTQDDREGQIHSINPATTNIKTPNATFKGPSAVRAMILAPRGAPKREPAARASARPTSTSPSDANVAAPTAPMTTTAASDVAWA